MSIDTDVAIVGAGFTGVAVAVHLLRLLPNRSRLLLAGMPDATGRGYAYGTDLPDHLLNVRAARMGVFADEPGDFVGWLRQQAYADADLEGSYQPRSRYGAYLRATLYRSMALHEGRVHAQVLETQVIDVERSGEGFVVQCSNGTRVRTSVVVLATGNACADFPFEVPASGSADRVIRDPFLDYRTKNIEPTASVLLVGTGLTMIDQLIQLDAIGHRGRVIAVSRHGLLPAVHPDPPRDAWRPRLGRPAWSMARLLADLVAEVERTRRGGTDWQSVIDGIRPQVQELWQQLPDNEQARFRRHVETFWSVHRHRMAPSVGARLRRWRDSGRLLIKPGRIIGVRGTEHGLTAALRTRGRKAVELFRVDWIVNCSGIGPRRAGTDQLLARLVGRGIARPGRFNWGVEVTSDNRVLDRLGRIVTGFYAAGPLTAGAFLEITAVPEIRQQAAAIATDITRHLGQHAATGAMTVGQRRLSWP